MCYGKRKKHIKTENFDFEIILYRDAYKINLTHEEFQLIHMRNKFFAHLGGQSISRIQTVPYIVKYIEK